MAKEYIEREALLKDISESVVFSVKEGQPSLEIRGANKITDRIKAAPAADVAEVVHGKIKWVNRPVAAQYATVTDEYGEKHYGKVYDRIENNPVGYCGECGKRLDDTFMNYCPNCGADMRGETNG